MTIKIVLKQNLFDATTGIGKSDPALYKNGIFAGIPRNRSVLKIGTGRSDFYIGKLGPTYDASHLSYRGGQTNMMIDSVGTEVSDRIFDIIMNNTDLRTSYGQEILDFVEKGIIEVYQTGTLLTAAQIDVFTA